MSYNLRKKAQVAETNLREQSEYYGLEVDGLKPQDKLLEDVRKDSEVIGTTEVQMEDDRKTASEITIEEKLNTAKSKLYNHRSQKAEKNPIKPLDLLNVAQEKERNDKYSKARVSDASTAFWDNYIGEQMEGEPTKQISKMGPSQLENSPERFKSINNLTEENVNTNLKNYQKPDNVKEMVMASLEDADAMLFHIYYQAAMQNRSLSSTESELVQGISKDKMKLLAQFNGGITNPNALLAKISQIESQMKAVEHHDHDALEQLHEQHEELLEQARTLVGQ